MSDAKELSRRPATSWRHAARGVCVAWQPPGQDNNFLREGCPGVSSGPEGWAVSWPERCGLMWAEPCNLACFRTRLVCLECGDVQVKVGPGGMWGLV